MPAASFQQIPNPKPLRPGSTDPLNANVRLRMMYSLREEL
jgi:hypothetical protein